MPWQYPRPSWNVTQILAQYHETKLSINSYQLKENLVLMSQTLNIRKIGKFSEYSKILNWYILTDFIFIRIFQSTASVSFFGATQRIIVSLTHKILTPAWRKISRMFWRKDCFLCRSFIYSYVMLSIQPVASFIKLWWRYLRRRTGLCWCQWMLPTFIFCAKSKIMTS